LLIWPRRGTTGQTKRFVRNRLYSHVETRTGLPISQARDTKGCDPSARPRAGLDSHARDAGRRSAQVDQGHGLPAIAERGPMSFFEIFQPGLQHLREERDRRKMLVVRPTHGGGGPLGIDLDAGTAKITVPRPKAEPKSEREPEVPDEVPAED